MREIELKESSIAAGSVAMQPRCGVPYRPELPAQSLYCPGSPCHQFLWELRKDKKAGVRQLLFMFLFLHPPTRDEHSNQENCLSQWNFEEFRPYYRALCQSICPMQGHPLEICTPCINSREPAKWARIIFHGDHVNCRRIFAGARPSYAT